MSEDRNNSQGLVGQSHTIEDNASPPPPSQSSSVAPLHSTNSRSIAIGGTIPSIEESPPRGLRTLLLRRGRNGFGLTLRHFILYPPIACCMLPENERTQIDEPMDTIFVQQVRVNSPAAEAGLRTGDRIVSVDGKSTRGESYAKVVQRIHHSGPWLRLLVVSREDDIIQRYVGKTAHYPETNERPQLRPLQRSSRKPPRSVSMIPGLSPRTKQSCVCPASGSEPTPMYQEPERATINPSCDQESRINELSKEIEQTRGNNAAQSTRSTMFRCKPSQEVPRYESSDEKVRLRNQQQSVKGSATNSIAQPYDFYDRTRSESIYSRTNSDQIYDRIKDPIYERVRVGEPMRTNEESPQRQQQYYPQQQTSLTRFPLSRAEPQVPTYPVTAKRANSRRASEGSTSSWTLNNLETTSFVSADALRSCEQGSRFSIDSRRDSSPARVNDPSYGGNQNENGNLIGYSANNGSNDGSSSTVSTSIDDSVIMTRLRKSFEQKEEFLRRPSHPIGWFLPETEERSESPVRSNGSAPSVIPREFYARPQKLQKQIWPPNESKQEQTSMSPKSSDKSLNSSNQNVQRKNKNGATEMEYIGTRNDHRIEESPPPGAMEHAHRQQQIATRSSFYEDDRSDLKESDRDRQRSGKSSNFVGTLSRIQEKMSNVGGPLSFPSEQQSVDRNGASSLPSSPGPDKKANDKIPTLPQGLQIVSKRAKQFESGRLLSDDDEPTGDRTSLYKSELSRLSNKRSVPNVAVRKREFESKAEAQEPRRLPALPAATRETKSLDSDTTRVQDAEVLRARIRSNSAESWDSTSAANSMDFGRHRWSQREEDDSERKRDANENDENDPYVDATNLNSSSEQILEKSSRRQDSYSQIVETEHGAVPDRSLDNDVHRNSGVVFRRQKNSQMADEDRATRRISYLKATWGERIHVDSDLELSDSEPIIHSCRSNAGFAGREATSAVAKSEQVEREGSLHVKFTVLDGKRSSDRSWKQVWGVLRGPILFFYKDRQNQSPSLTGDGENVVQTVDVRCSLVDIAEDYTKRKHVLRLANPGTEILLQTEDAASMTLWLRTLHEHAAAEKPSEIAHNSTLKQQAVPQTPCPTSSSTSSQTIANVNAMTISGSGGQRLSPLPGHKGIKKLTSFRNRSPTGQSPINKTRKPSQTIETLVSPKTKTWKGRVAKQLRRMHGQTGSPSSPTTQLPPEGGTFKVPLELCPASSFSEYVPLLVEMCTSIVEARGLEITGIYRVPGNTAAISQLTESVNKGFEHINLQDPRWSDVNVISSLLKSFFRQLPDSLLTAELYPMFIDADKVEDPQRRMTTIRKLLRDLPEHHFETLKYLMFHLKKIVEHSEVNKMEAKNLAIVFGPTLVRASGSRDNMVTMVTDMSHQCRIVESLLNNVDWFFSDDDLDDLSRLSVNLSLPADTSEIETTTSSNNHSLLLNNIQKVEGVREMASAKDIVSSIISAANRKIQRRRKCQDETDGESQQIDKSRMKQETESLANRRSMALNERQYPVSEIVLMHENKNQSSRSCTDRSERSPTHDGANSDANANSANVEGITDTLNNYGEIGPSDHKSKYSNHRSAVSSASESSRLSSETGLSFDVSSSGSNDTKQSNDEIAIRTYAGLSATTQERIRRFEQETKAMLQRDQNRQRREAERREEERRRIELEWQLAKREMEDDDLLDNIVDTAVTAPAYHLSSATRLASFTGPSRSTAARIQPLSIAVQQQPTLVRRVSQITEFQHESPTTLPSGNATNTVIKKLKTDTEISDSSTQSPVRYGSLDSLHDTQDVSQSMLSPTSQQRKPLSSDVSDDGSDLLTSLTTTFDRKWRSLVNSSNQTIRGSAENSFVSDEDVSKESQNSRNLRGDSQEGEKDENGDGERKKSVPQSVEPCSVESYRDPSLHKTSVERHQYGRQKDDAPEKDTDSTVAENSNVDSIDTEIPDNDRSAVARRKIESQHEQLSKEDVSSSEPQGKETAVLSQCEKAIDSSYFNKLKKFESLTNYQAKSRLRRSESLNKKSENTSSKLKRSESLNKHSVERLSSPMKRSESLTKHSERSDSPNSKLKRSESLTKTEKTECNISKRRQSVRKDSATKLKRKNGMPERSIKRRHTVGGTKDFDKVHWLDNKLQVETERVVKNDYRPKKSQLRTSSPDLSTGRIGLTTDASFLIEVSFRGPSNVVFNVTNARPQSLPDTSLASKVFKVPLESHV